MPQPQTPIDPEPDTVPHPYTNMSHHISLRSCIYTKTKGSKKLATLFLVMAACDTKHSIILHLC